MTKPKVISNAPEHDIAPITPFGKIEFSIDEKTLNALVKKSIAIKTINSAKDVVKIMPFIAALRNPRLVLDKERKAQKEASNAHGKLVQAEAAKLMFIIQVEEDRLQGIRKEYEDYAANEKRKELEAEAARKAKHRDAIKEIVELPGNLISSQTATINDYEQAILLLKTIEPVKFEEFSEEAEGSVSTALSVVGAAMGMAKQKEEQDAAQKKLDADRLELEEADAKLTAEREANIKEAERLAQEKIDQEVKVKRDEEAAAQKVLDDAEAVKKATADKKKEVAAEKKRKANIEKVRPDAEKLRMFASSLSFIELPELDTNQGAVTWIKQDLETLATKIVDTADGMIS